MRLLILGGSWFVGRALVEDAVGRGWDVSTFRRGASGSAPAGAATLTGDRESLADLRRLADVGEWDVVLDVAGSVPGVVSRSASALRRVTGRYALISTISVYRDWPHLPVNEDSPVWRGDPDYDPVSRGWDPDAYGPLKVGCELAVAREFDENRRLIIRPHVVVGPYEYVGRLPWWLSRFRRGGDVLAPGPDRPIQPVDVRDLTTFTLDQIEKAMSGVFNVAAPEGAATYGQMLAACSDAVATTAESPSRIVWVDEGWLVSRGVTQWTELPLWRNARAPWSMSTAKAQRAGLSCRPLRDTVFDTWAWLRAGGTAVAHERFAEHGIDPSREVGLLRSWRPLRATHSTDPSRRLG